MKKKTIASFAKNIILMSGTPDNKQKKLSNDWWENVCECSFRTAMEDGSICKPTMKLVNCANNKLISAVKAVYENEVKLYNNSNKLFMPVILVNCKSIDDIVDLRKNAWFESKAGKEFDFISIHSDKPAEKDADGNTNKVTAEINGERKTSQKAYEAIEAIDNKEITKPIIIAQVQMIGEGINIKSVTSAIVLTNNDKTAVQQIGRAIRNKIITKTVLEKKKNEKTGKFETVETVYTFSKVKDGYANVYIIQDNRDSVINLLANLSQYGLTDDCFSWTWDKYRKDDNSNGSAPKILEYEEYSKLKNNIDNDLTDVEIIDIDIDIITKVRDDYINNVDLTFKWGTTNEFKALAKKKIDEGMVEVWTNRKNGIKSDELLKIMHKKFVNSFKDNPINKLIWNKSKPDALNMIFQDLEMATFFKDHLTNEALSQLSKQDI